MDILFRKHKKQEALEKEILQSMDALTITPTYKVILLAPNGLVVLTVKDYKIQGVTWSDNLALDELNGWYVLDLVHVDQCHISQHKIQTKKFINLDLQGLESVISKGNVFDVLPKVKFPYQGIMHKVDTGIETLICCHFEPYSGALTDNMRWLTTPQKVSLLATLSNLWRVLCYPDIMVGSKLYITSTLTTRMECTFNLPFAVVQSLMSPPVDITIPFNKVIPLLMHHFPRSTQSRVYQQVIDFFRYSPIATQNSSRLTLIGDPKQPTAFKWSQQPIISRFAQDSVFSNSDLDGFLNDLGCPLLTAHQVQTLLLQPLTIDSSRHLSFLGDAFLHMLITWRIRSADPMKQTFMRQDLEKNETLAFWFDAHNLYKYSYNYITGNPLSPHAKGDYIEVILGYLYETYDQHVPDFIQDRIFSIVSSFSRSISKMDIYAEQSKQFKIIVSSYEEIGVFPVGWRTFSKHFEGSESIRESIRSHSHLPQVTVPITNLI